MVDDALRGADVRMTVGRSQFFRQVSTRNRDGTDGSTGQYWKGQEGVAYARAGGEGPWGPYSGTSIWSVSESHQHLFRLSCRGS